MSQKTPDRLDLKILDVLQQDARITNQALADLVALSPSACLARVRALEARGLIRSYRAHVAVDRETGVVKMKKFVAPRPRNA